MYHVIKDGEVIGATDEPRYIRIGVNGTYQRTDKENAQGLAFNSTPYNLLGLEPMDTTLETVSLNEVNAGNVVYGQGENIQQLQSDLTNTDEVAIELYEANLKQQGINQNTDDALIELYESLGG